MNVECKQGLAFENGISILPLRLKQCGRLACFGPSVCACLSLPTWLRMSRLMPKALVARNAMARIMDCGAQSGKRHDFVPRVSVAVVNGASEQGA